MLKSKIFIFGLLTLVVLFSTDFVFAQIELKGPPSEYEKIPLEVRYPKIADLELVETPSLPEYIRYIYFFSIVIAGLVAFASFVYGGFRYLISAGQPAAMAEAREQITAGIIGLLILLGSYLFLITINPQLTILKLIKPPPPELEISEVKPWEVKAEEINFYEIPIGQAIERVLEPQRLEAIVKLSEDIRKTSEDLKKFSLKYRDKIQECNNCANTSPPSCNPDNTCPSPVCTGNPCKDRAGAENAKKELKKKAEEMRPLVNSSLIYLVPLQQDNKLLQFASNVLLETFLPLSYSQYLSFRQITAEVGGIVERAPFIFEGVRLLPAGDFATFYTAEEQIEEIFAKMGPIFYTPYRITPTCAECEIDLHITNIDIPESTKEKMANMYPEGKIKASCPDGLDCWDYVIKKAKENGWNPIVLLAIWGEESAFSKTAIALGCDAEGIRNGVSPYTGDIVSQLKCFFEEPAQNCSGQCLAGNTDFCAFMNCYSSGPDCTLTKDSNFWPSFFWFYNEILPTSEDAPTGAEPKGNCSLQQEKLPPGFAGCPLQSEEVQVNCSFCGYINSQGRCHSGIDLRAPMLTPLYAVADGTIKAKYDEGYGFYIDLDTGHGVFRYAHLDEESTKKIIGRNQVRFGIKKGDLIGWSDATGFVIPPGAAGAHLHLEYLPNGITQIPVECDEVGIECIQKASGFIPVAPEICADPDPASRTELVEERRCL